MGNNILEHMMRRAELASTTPLQEWLSSLTPFQRSLMEQARTRGETSGAGFDLLKIEQDLRFKTIQEKDRRRRDAN